MSAEVRVSAAVITDARGRALVVRKHGTSVFMQPGGKPEPGETADMTLARELAEEIGLIVDPAALEPLGTYRADAANEPGHTVIAEVFAVTAEPADVEARAEIAELRWIDPVDAETLTLAPLSVEALLPLAWSRG